MFPEQKDLARHHAKKRKTITVVVLHAVQRRAVPGSAVLSGYLVEVRLKHHRGRKIKGPQSKYQPCGDYCNCCVCVCALSADDQGYLAKNVFGVNAHSASGCADSQTKPQLIFLGMCTCIIVSYWSCT